MGNKVMRKLLATAVALALVFTSGIGVFAADKSPEVGPVSKVKAYASEKNIVVSWAAADNATQYKVTYGKEYVMVQGTSTTLKIKANARYKVVVTPMNDSGSKVGKSQSVLRWTKKAKITKAKAKGSKKVTLTWGKLKGATKYQIYEKVNGKWKLRKTVGKNVTSATIKASKKGKGYFRVRGLKGSYIGVISNTKGVRVK